MEAGTCKTLYGRFSCQPVEKSWLFFVFVCFVYLEVGMGLPVHLASPVLLGAGRYCSEGWGQKGACRYGAHSRLR